jgi:hypothetical protein
MARRRVARLAVVGIHLVVVTPMTTLTGLEQAVLDLRALLARQENDFSWSSWADQTAALAEIDRHLDWIRRGAVPDLSALLMPTGPAQEVSLSSGWGTEFLQVAERIEQELSGL